MTELLFGERKIFTAEEGYVVLKQGKAEAYALRDENGDYRQLFLAELVTGLPVFAFAAAEKVKLQILATEDCELELIPAGELDDIGLVEACGKWHEAICGQEWLRQSAAPCCDEYKRLADFSDTAVADKLLAECLEQCFAEKKAARERHYDERLVSRKVLLDRTVGNLLLEDKAAQLDFSTGSDDIGKVAAVVKLVAAALKVEILHSVTLPAEIAARFDSVGILRRMVQKGGMYMRSVRLEDKWYEQDSGVMIGYYGETNEISALIPEAPGKYKIFNSQLDGVPMDEAIAAQLFPNAYACYAGLPARPLKKRDILKFVINSMWKKDLLMVLLVSIISGLMSMVMPSITQTVFEDIIPTHDYYMLTSVTQILVAAAFTTMFISIARYIAMMRLDIKVGLAGQAAIIGRTLMMPTGFFRKYVSGEMVHRVMSFSTIIEFLSGGAMATILTFVFSISSIFLMARYSLKLTGVSMLIWFIYIVISAVLYYFNLSYRKEKIKTDNEMSGMLNQIYAGIPKFRVSGLEEQAYYLLTEKYGQQWKWNLKLRWNVNYMVLFGVVQPILISLVLYVIVMNHIEAVMKTGSGDLITYPTFLAFQTAFASFNAALNSVIPTLVEFLGLKIYYDNVAPILQEPPETLEDKPDAEALQGNIDVNHLTFAYKENGPKVIDDLSLSIKAGENVAIVGRSGCGKSTFIRLLLGFERPDQGAIFYDGQNLADVSSASVRSQMGVVLQNGQLMSGDLFTNIAGAMAISLDEAWAAAEKAGMAQDIREMPMGMQTIISDSSSNISGGQRQRILIARALAARPAIIIFDEATSALDNKTQAIVTESLDKLKITRIVVAHRLSTIENCDRIIVLDKGTVAENGTYAELVARGGIFSEMVKRQIA